jgi:hypothetical protein
MELCLGSSPSAPKNRSIARPISGRTALAKELSDVAPADQNHFSDSASILPQNPAKYRDKHPKIIWSVVFNAEEVPSCRAATISGGFVQFAALHDTGHVISDQAGGAQTLKDAGDHVAKRILRR